MFHLSKNSDKSLNYISIHFIGLKIGFNICYIVVTTSDLIDVTLSIVVEVKNPTPIVSRWLFDNQHVTTNVETNTICLSTLVDVPVREKLTIYPSNQAFENALIHMSMKELSDKEIELRETTDTLKYAALLCKFSQQFGNCTLCNINDDYLTFSIEVNGSNFFHFPSVLKIPIHGEFYKPSILALIIYGEFLFSNNGSINFKCLL